MAAKRQDDTARRKAAHLRLLEALDVGALSDSCCEICHCDCYNSHRSDDESSVRPRAAAASRRAEHSDDAQFDFLAAVAVEARNVNRDTNNNYNHCTAKRPEPPAGRESRPKKAKSTKKRKQATTPSTLNAKSKSAKTTPTHCCHSPPPIRSEHTLKPPALVRRSKSVCSLRSRSPSPSTASASAEGTSAANQLHSWSKYYTRDCKILQQLVNALDDAPNFEINGKSALKPPQHMKTAASCESLPRSSDKAKQSATSLKLCASMANLCLAPTVRAAYQQVPAAYQQVPAHDKRILNRMASKRNEKLLAKENAWLARKYWENERYERELFKCAQMEEYKRAVRDKQFQDYLLTKARLNEIAQRDLSELRRLRESLQQKDACAKRRLDAIRLERGIALCQRRCDELRRSESVAVQQEAQNLDETLRKQETCARLTERLQRAEHIRTQMLDSYLRRLRYDNHIEQLLHEEHWREAQQLERYKRDQLRQQIEDKRSKTQRFAETRQRRNEASLKTAKISASLRELVRSSVTPEGAEAGASVALANTTPLAKVMLDRPFSKLSIE